MLIKQIFILFIFTLVLTNTVLGQGEIKGLVKDDKGQSISGASVFLSNTSIGTVTDREGNFSLMAPSGRYDLVVSFIGFEAATIPLDNASAGKTFSVILKPKPKELENVEIGPWIKDGWEKWGKFFVDNFIGTTDLSNHCRIRNTEVIKFRKKGDSILIADAMEPLEIVNNALGYRIRYDLVDFIFELKTSRLYFQGYPFFEELEGSESKKKTWTRRRQDAYEGSMMHFMRAVFRNRIEEEGFAVYRLSKKINAEKQRVKQAMSKNFTFTREPSGMVFGKIINSDSNEYYRKVMKQEDFTDSIYSRELPGDSIAYAIDKTTAGLEFPDFLLVIYKHGKAPKEYQLRFPYNDPRKSSQITLENSKMVAIEANGSYYQPFDLVALGYWAWWEKTGTMLPFDYKPRP